MSVLQVARSLHDYNAWANDQMLSAMDGMTDAELMAPAPVPLGNLRGALWHTMSAQMGWLRIVSGIDTWSRVPVRDSSSVGGLREMFDGSHELWSEYLGSLDEAGVLHEIDLPMDDNFRRYASPEELAWATEHGHRPRRPVWQSILHVVNHSTEHRGQIGMYLHTLSRSPGDLDYGTFEEDRAVRGGSTAHTGA